MGTFKNEPYLIDKPIGEIQDYIRDAIPWLDNIFGRVQILVRDGKKYPAFKGCDNDYRDLCPDDSLGNYAFFIVRDPLEIKDFSPHIKNNLISEISIVLWFSIDSAEPDASTEKIKSEILSIIGDISIKSGQFILEKVYETDIFNGFSVNESQIQHMMFPYYGFRITGKLYYKELC